MIEVSTEALAAFSAYFGDGHTLISPIYLYDDDDDGKRYWLSFIFSGDDEGSAAVGPTFIRHRFGRYSNTVMSGTDRRTVRQVAHDYIALVAETVKQGKRAGQKAITVKTFEDHDQFLEALKDRCPQLAPVFSAMVDSLNPTLHPEASGLVGQTLRNAVEKAKARENSQTQTESDEDDDRDDSLDDAESRGSRTGRGE